MKIDRCFEYLTNVLHQDFSIDNKLISAHIKIQTKKQKSASQNKARRVKSKFLSLKKGGKRVKD